MDWSLLVPIQSGDEWVTEELKKRSVRFVTYDAKDGYTGDNVAKLSGRVDVDLEGLANL